MNLTSIACGPSSNRIAKVILRVNHRIGSFSNPKGRKPLQHFCIKTDMGWVGGWLPKLNSPKVFLSFAPQNLEFEF